MTRNCPPPTCTSFFSYQPSASSLTSASLGMALSRRILSLSANWKKCTRGPRLSLKMLLATSGPPRMMSFLSRCPSRPLPASAAAAAGETSAVRFLAVVFSDILVGGAPISTSPRRSCSARKRALSGPLRSITFIFFTSLRRNRAAPPGGRITSSSVHVGCRRNMLTVLAAAAGARPTPFPASCSRGCGTLGAFGV